jgi:hypothetical protein
MIFDRAAIFSAGLTATIRSMLMEPARTSFRSPRITATPGARWRRPFRAGGSSGPRRRQRRREGIVCPRAEGDVHSRGWDHDRDPVPGARRPASSRFARRSVHRGCPPDDPGCPFVALLVQDHPDLAISLENRSHAHPRSPGKKILSPGDMAGSVSTGRRGWRS